MRKQTLIKLAAAGLCICVLTGCSAGPAVKSDSSKLTVNSNANTENTKDSSEESGKNDLLNAADMQGNVLEFTADGCSVSQSKEIDGGAGIKAEADGMENMANAVTVTYSRDCEFVIAEVNAQAGVTNVTTGTVSDVKKQSEVYLYGDFTDTLHFNAAKVVIAHWE